MPLIMGAVLYANDETIAPCSRHQPGCSLPRFQSGTPLVIKYEVVEGRNVLVQVPEVRG